MLARKKWVAFMLQSATVLTALVAAWLLRFDFTLPQREVMIMSAPLLLLCRWAGMYVCSLTHIYWRHTGLGDLKDVLRAVAIGSALFFVLIRWLIGVVAFPLSVYLLEGMLAFFLLAGLRVGSRMLLQAREARIVQRDHGLRTNIIIVGAGSAAAQLLPEARRNYNVVGLVDDDRAKHNTKLCSVPVIGAIHELPTLVHRFAVREILIAIPCASGAQMLRITDFCGRAGVPFRALPGLADLIDGRVAMSKFREVNLDELLGREPVRLESGGMLERLQGRVVMVTGAAGSIGSELCKQIARCHPRKLICVDQGETPLFNLQQRILTSSTVEIIYSVADITDTERMRDLLLDHKVSAIFHAAAYKHVPMTEANPYEGLKNNVFGLWDLVETADECGCEDFLLISSDKAVKPSSLMGCTKRLGEMIVGSHESSDMRCVSVRFGNVLGSQGSVIPVFQEQIRTCGSITVTHPEMTRYFMTIPEAVALVLQAFTVGAHGDILVLDMGEPVRILDLAKTLVRMSGKNEDDVAIVFTGMRPGEKLHEELFYDSEVRVSTLLSKVMQARTQLPSWAVLSRRLREMRTPACRRNPELIRERIKQIIPEYQWQPKAPMEVVPVSLEIRQRRAANTGSLGFA